MAQAIRQEALFYNQTAQEYYGAQSPSRLPLPRELPQDLPQAEPRRRVKPQNHFLTVVSCFAAACVLLLVVFSHLRLYEASCQVTSLQNQLSDLRDEQIKLRSAYDKAVDLVAIEQMATTTLGMNRPAAGQTVYLNLSGNDRAEVLRPTRSGLFTELADFVCGAFQNLGAYLAQN